VYYWWDCRGQQNKCGEEYERTNVSFSPITQRLIPNTIPLISPLSHLTREEEGPTNESSRAHCTGRQSRKHRTISIHTSRQPPNPLQTVRLSPPISSRLPPFRDPNLTSPCLVALPCWNRRLRPTPMTVPSERMRAAPMGTPPSERPVAASAKAWAMPEMSNWDGEAVGGVWTGTFGASMMRWIGRARMGKQEVRGRGRGREVS
jgi:hypothetical protein